MNQENKSNNMLIKACAESQHSLKLIEGIRTQEEACEFCNGVIAPKEILYKCSSCESKYVCVDCIFTYNVKKAIAKEK